MIFLVEPYTGAGPIRLAWSAVVLPSLVLNYAGQAAMGIGAQLRRQSIDSTVRTRKS